MPSEQLWVGAEDSKIIREKVAVGVVANLDTIEEIVLRMHPSKFKKLEEGRERFERRARQISI